MRFHWQDLNDGEPKRYWLYGRAWWGVFAWEWHTPGGSRWSITIGGGDSGRNLGVTVSVPWLLTFYLTLQDVLPRDFIKWDVDRGGDRQIGCYFYEWTFHYDIWVGSMASWSRSYPWCRWWRQGSIDFADLALGRRRHRCELLKDGIPVVIPMPEGVYHGTAKIERRTWKRPRWFAFSRVSTTIDCPKGIPFSGKGENSWDCGDDGLFGWGAEGASIEKAIAHGVESVLTSRREAAGDCLQYLTVAEYQPRLIWDCRVCGFGVVEGRALNYIRVDGHHRNALGSRSPNTGVAYCPYCDDETLRSPSTGRSRMAIADGR